MTVAPPSGPTAGDDVTVAATSEPPVQDLVKGGTFFAGAMLVANAGNYVLNLLLGRWLTPAEFSDINLMVTLMLTVTAIALCLQLVAARFVGRADAAGRPAEGDATAGVLRRWAAIAGIASGAVLAGPAVWWQHVFHTASPWPFVILGVGMPFYLVQAVGRGVLQGRLRFTPLGLTFLVEMVVRVGAGVLLVRLGAGVDGATAALTASFVATWIAVRVLAERGRRDRVTVTTAEIRRYAGSVSVLLVAQIIANNSDVLAAKAYFAPHDAGIYSAVALVGRAVFFLSWSVATVVFPASARQADDSAETRRLLRGGIAAVGVIGLLCTVGAWLVGGPVLRVVLGPDYDGLSSVLAAYAAMTTMFAVANLVASHYLSLGRSRPATLLLIASVVQVVLILAWHDNFAHMISAQAVAMAALLVVMAVAPLLLGGRRGRSSAGPIGTERTIS